MLLFLAAAAQNAVAQDRSEADNLPVAESRTMESVVEVTQDTPFGIATGGHGPEANDQRIPFQDTDKLVITKIAPDCEYVRLPNNRAPRTCEDPHKEGTTYWVTWFTSGEVPATFARTYTMWTVDGTAKAEADYVSDSIMRTMEVGETYTQAAIFTINQDTVDEDQEYFYIRYEVDSNMLSIIDDYLVLPIADDDDPPGLSIADATGTEDSGELEFAVTLNAESEKTITVNFATGDGTATAPGDYTGKSGTLTLAPGDTSATISVSIADDGLDEESENFTVTLSNPMNVTVDDGDATGTIEDTGFNPTASVADAKGLEDTVGDLAFAVTVSPAHTEIATLAYATANGTATEGTDYTPATGTLTFAAGETTKTISVPVSSDTTVEADETLTLTLSQGNNKLRIGDGSAMGTIGNDDFELSITESRQGREGVRLVFPVTLRGGGAGRQTVTVEYETSALTATADVDYDTVSGTLTFPTGVGERSITVNVPQDTLAEADEQFEVVLSNASGAVITAAKSTATILDDDQPEITVEDATASEEAGTLDFPVRLSDPIAVAVTVEYETSDVTAIAGQDYVGVDDTLTFAAGETERTIEVTLINDGLSENDELFLLKLSDPNNAALVEDSPLDCPFPGVAACAVGTIQDNDQTPALSVADAAASESDNELEFVVTAANLDDPNVTVTVRYATSDNTATAGTDYEPASGTLTFTSTTTTQTVSVAVLDDRLDETGETLAFTLSDPMGAELDDADAVGTINDDDVASSAVVLTAEPRRVREDELSEVVVTATLNASARTTATRVTVSVAASGATDAVDFEEVPTFTITIAAGVTSDSGTFTLTPDNDAVDETDETIAVEGMSDLPVTPTTVTLADNDEPSTGIELSARPTLAVEGGGAVEVTVTATLNGGAGTATRKVGVTVSGSGDADAVDFDPVPNFEVTIEAGNTFGTGTFTLTPQPDLLDEMDETLTVAGNSDLPVTPTTVTLSDDDDPPTAILLSAAPERIVENGGTREVRVAATFDRGALAEATAVAVTVAGTAGAGAVGFAASRAEFTIMIEAGATEGSGTFSVTPEDDDVDERDEVLDIAGASALPVTGTTVTLADDDEPPTAVLLSAAPERIAEGGGTQDVEVTATFDRGALAEATAVAVTVAGTAGAGAVGFAASPAEFTIMIEAGATEGRGTFSVTPEDDVVDERDEVLDIGGTTALPVTGTTVTLADDDVPSTRIELSAMPATVAEGAGSTQVTVTATLDGGARLDATEVAVSVSGGTEPEAVDFDPVEGFTITIDAGATAGTGTFALVPEQDEVAESNETLAVEGTADVPVTGASVTLVDDDAASTAISLSATPGRATEGGGAVAVRVTAALNRAARREATVVSVSVAGSGAPGTVDFAAVDDFTVTIPAGAADGEGSFTLEPVNDAVQESDETLTVSGTSDLPVTPDTVTLADDDEASTAISLSATPGRATEGGGAVAVRVTAALNRAARREATVVSVSVAGSGAPGTVDFAAVDDFTVTIPAGAADGEGSFTLEPVNDAVQESDETLTVSGTSDLPVTPDTVTLTDDDEASTAITLSVTPERLSEGAGATRMTVTASFDRGLRATPTTVSVSVSGGSNPAAVGFAPVDDFTVTIRAGARSGEESFTLTPEADAVAESDATLTVSGASDLPVTPASVTLADDDEASTRVVLSAAPARVSEGVGPTPVTVTAALDRGLRQTATLVTVSVAGSGAADAADFEPVNDFRITIPAGLASGTGMFVLTPEDDQNVEDDETLTMTGQSDLPVTPASVLLADDDEFSTRILLFLSVNPAQALEGGGPVEVTVTAAVDRATRTVETRVAVTVSASGDPLAVDFEPVPDFEIVIPADALSGMAMFTVTPEDDLVVERDETVTVAGNSDLPVTPTTLTLVDDDEVVVALSAAPTELAEDGGPVAVAVTATLTGGVRQVTTTVSVSVSASGNPDAVDFAPVADFAITIPAGAAAGEGAFTLAPEDDREDESDETVAVAGTSDLLVTPTSVRILDDDLAAVPPALTVADATAAEGGGELAFVVDLDAPAEVAVTVSYATADHTAEAGSDYEAAAGTLAFLAGEVSKTIRVALIDDALDEHDETLRLDLSHPRNSTLARASALGTIFDDDEPPELTVADATAVEGGGELAFVVDLDAPAEVAVTVSYATADHTAEAGSDYEAAAGTLAFLAGEVSKTIRVALIDDALDEHDETLRLDLSHPRNSTLARASALGTIFDDDEPPELTVADAAGDEAAGPLAFVVDLSRPSGVEVSVAYATSDTTATAGTDYEAVSGTLEFAPGIVSGTIVVPVLDDAGHESDETFQLELSDPRNATLADAAGTGTIRDDDLSPPTLAGAFPDAALCVGGAAFELDLAAHFEGEDMRFSASSSAPEVATAAITGSRLVIAPVAEGTATVAVTASNEAGAAEGAVRVRVVTDPAELAAVEALLAAIGRGVLLGVADAVADRIAVRGARDRESIVDGGNAFGGTDAFSGMGIFGGTGTFGVVPPAPSPVTLDDWRRPPGFEPIVTDRFDTFSGGGLAAVPGLPGRGMAPFSFSLAAPAGGNGTVDPAWSVWGRGEQRRFEGGEAGASHDGTLTGILAGVDIGDGDWLGGISVMRSRAEADYRFARSVDACGGGPDGDGVLDAELTGVHPYGGRRVGRGWLWAALGAGQGDVSVERCDSGHVDDADLSMRLAMVGGRHPFVHGGRLEVSVVEDFGIVEVTTTGAEAPVGDHSVTAGHAKIGLEAAGVAPPGCECSLATYVRAFARRDWGDGVTGTGLELAAGLRYQNLPRRLGIDAGVRALASHSAEDAAEHGAHLAVSLLPAADGSGWRAALAWRRDGDPGASRDLNGLSPWAAPPGGRAAGRSASAARDWRGDFRFGYGFVTRRWTAVPFLELDTAPWSRGQSRLGVRHDFSDGARSYHLEWSVERRGGQAGASNTDWILVVSGRF